MSRVERSTAVAALCIAFAAGWLLHPERAVHAQDAGSVYFQLQGLGQDGALTLYYPSEPPSMSIREQSTGMRPSSAPSSTS